MSKQTEQTFTSQGHEIDLDRLYRAMWEQAEPQPDGTRLFDGQKAGVKGIPKLLTELFGVPEPVKKDAAAKKGGKAAQGERTDATRIECRDRLGALGWATKREGTKAQYALSRTV